MTNRNPSIIVTKLHRNVDVYVRKNTENSVTSCLDKSHSLRFAIPRLSITQLLIPHSTSGASHTTLLPSLRRQTVQLSHCPPRINNALGR